MRVCDQRVLGHYDTTPRSRLATAEYGSMEAAEQVQANNDNMPFSRMLDELADIEEEGLQDAAQPPFGRMHHDEADTTLSKLPDEVEEQEG